MGRAQHPDGRDVRELTVDAALEQFLTEYLTEEKGQKEKTVNDCRGLHERWFSPTIGDRRVSRVDAATMDRVFGAMRQAGLSDSRLNQAKSLYAPFFSLGQETRNHDKRPDGRLSEADERLSRERADPAGTLQLEGDHGHELGIGL